MEVYLVLHLPLKVIGNARHKSESDALMSCIFSIKAQRWSAGSDVLYVGSHREEKLGWTGFMKSSLNRGFWRRSRKPRSTSSTSCPTPSVQAGLSRSRAIFCLSLRASPLDPSAGSSLVF
ncbi:unnamed protein product [Linum trigynum]|uniref:Uncharacterized protein n=1 Tax=Linum trigynum TaxID=586398 RepID=A0AAV2D7X9_9ROSI